MANPQTLEEYKRGVRRYFKSLAPIFAKAAIGDFSKDVTIPPEDNELTEFFVGVQIILDAIREKIRESESHLAHLNTSNDELAHEKAVYASILISIAEGLIVVDKEEHITLINQAAASALGLKAEEVIGHNYYDTILTKDKNNRPVSKERHPLRKALLTGKQQVTTLADGLQHVRSDGSTIPIAITASPVELGTKIIGGVSTFRDISEEKQLDRAKSEIISIASHQLRTPLTAVKWLSESLTEPTLKMSETKRQSYIRQIHTSNEHMIALVNDLLNVSRIELGTLVLDIKPVNIPELIEDVLKDLAPQLTKKHIIIEKEVGRGLQAVNTDPRHIQVIVQNLLSNAVKYTRPKKRIIIIAKKKEEQLYIAVKDEGYGIPASQQHRIFSKLFRADNAQRIVSEGTGLGLYACKAMVEQLGGKINFDSVENQGTIFHVTLPLKVSKEAAKTSAT